jgi:hypothetical protein
MFEHKFLSTFTYNSNKIRDLNSVSSQHFVLQVNGIGIIYMELHANKVVKMERISVYAQEQSVC